MALRTRERGTTIPASITDNMDGVFIREDGLMIARFKFRRADNTEVTILEPISDALRANITARASFQTFLDNVEADTYARALKKAGL